MRLDRGAKHVIFRCDFPRWEGSLRCKLFPSSQNQELKAHSHHKHGFLKPSPAPKILSIQTNSYHQHRTQFEPKVMQRQRKLPESLRMTKINEEPMDKHRKFIRFAKELGIEIDGVEPAIRDGKGTGVVASRPLKVCRPLSMNLSKGSHGLEKSKLPETKSMILTSKSIEFQMLTDSLLERRHPRQGARQGPDQRQHEFHQGLENPRWHRTRSHSSRTHCHPPKSGTEARDCSVASRLAVN